MYNMNKWKEFVSDGHMDCDLPNLSETPAQDYSRIRNWVNVNIERIERSVQNHLKEVQLCRHLDDEEAQIYSCLDDGIKGIENALHHLKSLRNQIDPNQ
jgi:hypothetical protein